MVTMLDDHSRYIIFLTETPPHTQSGALKHVLRNRDYCTHYHPENAPSPPDPLPEARIPAQLTHARGGSWLAYKKHTSWSPMIRPLTLPEDCPRATTCAVKLTLLSGTKAAFIACYLPQPLEEHAQVCKALANLPQVLPHQILILGGDLQGDWEGPSPKTPHITSLPFERWKGPTTPTFQPHQQPNQASFIDHLTIWDPDHITQQIGVTQPSIQRS